ncbi:hypothetical protein GCM10017744_013960 [Streptomyces antimycoticus]
MVAAEEFFHRVQGAVEQGGVQSVAVGLAALFRGQAYLGEHLLAEPPCGVQAAEGGPVGVALRGQPLVQVRHVDRGGPGGWPGRGPRFVVGRWRDRIGQYAGGVVAPGGRGIQGLATLVGGREAMVTVRRPSSAR